MIHDAPAGRMTVHDPTDFYALVQGAMTRGGLSVREAASALFGSTDLEDNQIEKARRQLDSLVKKGRIQKIGDGGTSPVKYVPVERRRDA